MFHDMDGWWILWGGLMMMLFWGGFVGLVVWVIRSLPGRDQEHSSRPLEIAERRYARGEITREEFEQIRQDLAVRSRDNAGT